VSYRCYGDIRTQAEAWNAALAVVDEQVKEIRELLGQPPDDVLFTACGSPYYMWLSNATLWREKLGARTIAFPSSEAMLFPGTTLPEGGRPVLLAASRSGETTETIRAINAFSERFPGRTILIGCRPGSTLDKLADVSVMIPEGYEDVIPQTRSFGSMYLAAQYLASLLANDNDLADALRRLPGALPSLLDRWDQTIHSMAETKWDSAVFLGGGPLYGVAVESALKVTEMSLSKAVAYHTLEVRHGPRSVIDEDTLVVSLGSRRGERHENLVLGELAESTGPRILALSPDGVDDHGDVATEISVGADIPEHALGVLYLPLLQLLAYHRAVHKGADPDESQNLTSYIELSEG
jgi:glutamine---fructose-6-phosphate transaminase (isomerizing)